jgi:hypothetical protein
VELSRVNLDDHNIAAQRPRVSLHLYPRFTHSRILTSSDPYTMPEQDQAPLPPFSIPPGAPKLAHAQLPAPGLPPVTSVFPPPVAASFTHAMHTSASHANPIHPAFGFAQMPNNVLVGQIAQFTATHGYAPVLVWVPTQFGPLLTLAPHNFIPVVAANNLPIVPAAVQPQPAQIWYSTPPPTPIGGPVGSR